MSDPRPALSPYWLLIGMLLLCVCLQSPHDWPAQEIQGFASAARISGRVVDKNNQPLVATLTLRQNQQLISEIQTQDGLFAWPDLALGDYHLSVASAGKASQQLSLSLDPTHPAQRVIFQLGSAATISGIVRDSTGLPIEGAEVSAVCQQKYRLLFADQQTHTDAQGKFSFPTLSEGTWLLQARRDASAPSVLLSVDAPQDNVTLVLPEGQGISGRLVDAETGLPLPLANVTLGGSGLWPNKHTSTDRDGRFAFFALPDGVYSISATAIRADGVPMATTTEEGIGLESGLPTPMLTLAAEEAFFFHGEVYSPSAELLPGALVQISQEASFTLVQQVFADNEGRFAFEAVPAGEAFVRILADDIPPPPPLRVYLSSRTILDGPPSPTQEEISISRASTNPLPPMIAEDRVISVALFLPPLVNITGSVRDEAGKPIEGAWLFVESTTGEILADATLQQGQLRFANAHYGTNLSTSRVFSTGREGAFQVSLYESTEVVFVAQAQGYASSAARCRPQTTCLLTLDTARELRVRVVDSDGRPIAEARGRAFQGDAAVVECLSESGGFLRCAPVGRKTSLRVRAPGYTTVTKENLSGDGETITLLPNDAMLAGYVVDEKGFPIEGAEIDIFLGELLIQTSSNTDGTFSAENLPRGEASIRVVAEGYAPLQTQASGEDVSLVLREGGSLAGEIEDERGASIAWAQVEVVGSVGMLSTDGTFLFESIPSGEVEILVTASGYAESKMRVSIENGETTHVVMKLSSAGLLQLKVRRSDGSVAAGAELVLQNDTGERVELRTDSSGAVSRAGLRVGTWRLLASLEEEGAETQLVIRAGETLQEEVQLRREEGPLRIAVEGMTFTLQLDRLLVTAVQPQSEAESAGLHVGDEVLSINEQRIGDTQREEIFAFFQAGNELRLQLRSAQTGAVFGIELSL